MLALDYSGERSQRLPITAAMTIATITPLMPVRLDLRFGIGAIPIRATTLRYPNARFPGEKLFSNGLEIAGWVSLWRPIEIFLYEWWPYWRENQLYAQVMNMQIVITEEKEMGHRTVAEKYI